MIIAIGDTPIDNQGMIKLGPDQRVNFRYLVQKLGLKGGVPLRVVRAGKTVPVELPVAPKRPLLIPRLEGGQPSYFIFGPVVFSSATAEIVASLTQQGGGAGKGGGWLPKLMIEASPLLSRLFDRPAFEGEELVVIASRSCVTRRTSSSRSRSRAAERRWSFRAPSWRRPRIPS